MLSFRLRQKRLTNLHIIRLTAFALVMRVLVPALAFHVLVHALVEVLVKK